MNFLSRFNRIAAFSYGAAIFCAALLFSSLYQETRVNLLNSLRFQLLERVHALNIVLRIRADVVRSLKTQAEDFLNEPQNPLMRPTLVKKRDGFSLDPTKVIFKKTGNLMGNFPLENISEKNWHEITMAYRLNPLFRVITQNIQTIMHAYYISQSGFLTIYPWVDPINSHFCGHKTPTHLATKVLKRGIEKDELFWSDTYMNQEKKLIMTSAALIYKGKDLYGVVAIDFNLGAFSYFFEHLHDSFGRFLVINDSLSILEDTGIHKDAIEKNLKVKLTGTLPHNLSIHDILHAPARTLTEKNGYWVFHAPTDNAPWKIIYYVDRWDILAGTLKGIGPGFLFIFIFTTVILFATHWAIRQEFIQPAQKLVNHIIHQGQDQAFLRLKEPWLSWFSIVTEVFKENRILVKSLQNHIQDLDKAVAKRTKDLSKRNKQLEDAFERLKSAQSQIILQEKMAGLGALTASIAHEIKNPLNFIINFSINSQSFMEELKSLLQDDRFKWSEEQLNAVQEILQQLHLNLDKIQTHGMQADLIIHSMLVHARGGEDSVDDVNMNKLIAENILLVVSSFKQKGFSPFVNSHLMEGLPSVKVCAQDIGRVLLNILTNSFDALLEKKKKDRFFVPEIKISTRQRRNGIECRIRDNGPGIAEKIQKKIFEPFFTTKPVGRGTGLGLSISYDIITQQHGGTLTLNSKEGVYCEFVIYLPYSKK